MGELLTAAVDCKSCGNSFEVGWLILDRQELDEPPVGLHPCPHCGAEHEYEYPGWTYSTEAG